MKFKPQPWQLIVLIAVVCGAAIGGMVWFHSTTLTPEALLKRMPSNDSLLMWIDFAALRRAGFLQLLAGAKSTEDPEYQSFVFATRFDYMNDLDSALVSFPRSGGSYFMVWGRFDWKNLRAYVSREHGLCVNSLCRLVGSTPDRHISFLPLRTGLMAMAVSTDQWAVNDLTVARPGPNPAMPEGFVWLRFPGSMLQSAGALPSGTASLARILETAPIVTISFVPEADRLSAKLEIVCRDAQQANDLAAELAAKTEMARHVFAEEHQKPSPADFSGIVTSGVFRTEGSRVLGAWPIEKAFVQNLLGTQ